MRNTFGSAIWAAVIGVSVGMAACGDDDGGAPGDNGGEAAGGEAVGGEPGTKGGSGGKAGSSNVDAGAGGVAQAGASPTDGGAAHAGESAGGAAGASEGGGGPIAPMGGAGGEGGAPTPTLEYACTANTINHKVCSAFSAAACPEEFDCATCVGDRKTDRDSFNECATCLAEFDKYYQCGIDAFESGNLASGVECVPGYGPDMTLDCFEHFESAMNCAEWTIENPCPETWPLD